MILYALRRGWHHWERRLSPLTSCVIVTAAVFGLVWIVQAAGGLQGLELTIYDWFASQRAHVHAWNHPGAASDPRIVVVGVTKSDIAALDYPLSDETMADLLERILAEKPRAVGLDIYRDLPVPRDGRRTQRLRAVFAQHPEVVAGYYYGPERVPPPAFLANSPDQVGFVDFPYDGRLVRRALLYVDEPEETWYSLSAQLARKYLAGEKTPMELCDSEVPGCVCFGGKTVPRFRQTDGAYVHADDRGYQYFLDFAGPGPGQFTSYSVQDTLQGRTGANAFADKVVLIGGGHRSLNDVLTIPLEAWTGEANPSASLGPEAHRLPRLQTPGDVFGVEVHAMAVNQLLRLALGGERPPAVWPNWAELLWLALAAVVGALAGFWIRCPWRLLLAIFGGAALFFFASGGFFLWGYWVPAAAPASCAFFAAILASVNASGRDSRERHELMSMFARSLSQPVAEELWRNRDALAAEGRLKAQELTATILFSDVKGFSTISEHLNPAELLEFMNRYMTQMAGHIKGHGGLVLKYIGDAIMAVFGAPIPAKDRAGMAENAAHAVEAALAMERALASYNTEHKHAGRPPVRMRIGIETGPVVAGCLGSADRFEYTALGDTVNTASRLESWNKDYEDLDEPIGDCRILIGGETYELVAGKFRMKLVAKTELTGKSNQTRIYRVLGFGKPAGPAAAANSGK